MMSIQSTTVRARITSQRSEVWRAGALAAVAAAVVNVALFAAGSASDVTFLLAGGQTGSTQAVTLAHVLVATVLSTTLGTGAAFAVARSRRGSQAVIVAAVIVALVTAGAPLSLGLDTPTRLLLAAMHLVTGTAFVVALRRTVPGGADAL